MEGIANLGQAIVENDANLRKLTKQPDN